MVADIIGSHSLTCHPIYHIRLGHLFFLRFLNGTSSTWIFKKLYKRRAKTSGSETIDDRVDGMECPVPFASSEISNL